MKELGLLLVFTLFSTSTFACFMPAPTLDRALSSPNIVLAEYIEFKKIAKRSQIVAAQYKIIRIFKGKIKVEKIQVAYNPALTLSLYGPIPKKFSGKNMPVKGTQHLLFLEYYSKDKDLYYTYREKYGRWPVKNWTKDDFSHFAKLIDAGQVVCKTCRHNKRVTRILEDTNTGITWYSGCYGCSKMWRNNKFSFYRPIAVPKSPACSKCKVNKKVIPIVYADYNPFLMKLSHEGKLFLAVCYKPKNAPDWRCSTCKISFNP